MITIAIVENLPGEDHATAGQVPVRPCPSVFAVRLLAAVKRDLARVCPIA
ncbi:MAG: hypothetical protein R6V12_13875 [Candidatus Hydrogenedentota bacterium]